MTASHKQETYRWLQKGLAVGSWWFYPGFVPKAPQAVPVMVSLRIFQLSPSRTITHQ
jgi:hypothetical protein